MLHRKLIVGDEQLSYTWSGVKAQQTPPLILIHGAGGNALHWPPALRHLSGHEVYALDLPGHGRSAGHARATIGAYAEDVAAFADALSLPPFVLAGHSMGGAIAIELALRQPERLAGLILIATGAKLSVAPAILDGLRTDFAAVIELLVELAHGTTADVRLDRIYRQRLREVTPAVLQADLAACDAFDRRAGIAAIALPTLVICGAADRMTPVKYSQFLADRIRGAQLVIVPDAGHMVMLEPAGLPIVVRAIRQFLDERARQPQLQVLAHD